MQPVWSSSSLSLQVHPQPDWYLGPMALELLSFLTLGDVELPEVALVTTSRWYMGGRAKPGESPQQAAARVMRRELLERPPEIMALAMWRQAMVRGVRQTWEHLNHSLWRAPAGPLPQLAGAGPGPAGPGPAPGLCGRESASQIFGHWSFNLRPREFSVRLDVKMKRAAAPYPRNPNRKKPVPKVKGIIRKLMK
eukprot:Skav210329  [mRNA]  locus=scaffold475:361647:363562:- [translate_table: standard]